MFLLFSIPTVFSAESCAVCGRTPHGSYLKSADGAIYCSQECFNQTRPLCVVCAKRIKGDYLKRDDETFCSRECFESVLPECEICKKRLTTAATIDSRIFCEECAAGNRCFQCQLPYSKGRTFRDGRHICAECDKHGVYSKADAEKLYKGAAREVESFTGISLRPLPEIELSGIDKIRALATDYDENVYVLRGTYQSETTINRTVNIFGRVLKQETEQSGTVFILYGLSKRRFVVTASHELTHDLIEKAFPTLLKTELWIQEGLCQYIAHAVASKLGIEEAVNEIEKHDDAIYGKGFRWYKTKFGVNNWPAVHAWLQTLE